MVVRLDAPQPTFALPPIDQIPDGVEDKPKSGLPLVISIVLYYFASCLLYLQEILGPFRFPALVFGAASFSHQYNDDDHLASLMPLRTVRLALRYVRRTLNMIKLLTDPYAQLRHLFLRHIRLLWPI
jgi:hypothetical protein